MTTMTGPHNVRTPRVNEDKVGAKTKTQKVKHCENILLYEDRRIHRDKKNGQQMTRQGMGIQAATVLWG